MSNCLISIISSPGSCGAIYCEKIVGIEGPVKSRSNKPTFGNFFDKERAILTAVVDLPTPTLPDITKIYLGTFINND